MFFDVYGRMKEGSGAEKGSEWEETTMPINIRIADDVVILSNFARLMDDPRHFDAVRDVEEFLDQGYRNFVLELRAINEMGDSGLGLLMTITRRIRQRGGDVVLASPSRSMVKLIEMMQLDDFWESYPSVPEARAALSSME